MRYILIIICLILLNVNNISAQSCINSSSVVVIQSLLKTKVFLQGNYDNNTSQMTVNTAFQQQLPTTQPFNRTPWNYAGNETISNIPADMVDWVLIDILDVNNYNLLSSQAALLLKDGRVVDPEWIMDNTIQGVYVNNVVSGMDYFVVIRHRNHLAVMSSTAVIIPNTNSHDFSQVANVMQGNTQVTAMADGNYALFAGDFNSDGIVNVQDFNGYGLEISNVNQYMDSDFSLDANNTIQDFNQYRSNASIIGIPVVRY